MEKPGPKAVVWVLSNPNRFRSQPWFGIAVAWRDLQAKSTACANPARAQPKRGLRDAEPADRQARSLRYPLKAARCPTLRDLTACDGSDPPFGQCPPSGIGQGSLPANRANLILVGRTGTGKTVSAIACGGAVLHHAKRIGCSNAVDLVRLLEPEKPQGKAGNQPKQRTQCGAVIRDALGWLASPASGIPGFGGQTVPRTLRHSASIHLISQLYQKTSRLVIAPFLSWCGGRTHAAIFSCLERV